MSNTWDKTVNCGTVAGRAAMPVQVFKTRIDLNAISGLAANDTINVFKLPQGCIVMAFGCKVVVQPAGTALTLTFGAAHGATVSGTAAVLAGSTAQAVGTVDPATITAGANQAVSSLASAPANYFEWLEVEEMGAPGSTPPSTQPLLTVSPTTVTGVTDFGEYDFYAVIADLTGVVTRDPASTRTLTEFGQVTGAPMV